MPAGRYAITKGEVVVKIRSSIHDSITVWSKPGGFITLDPEAPANGPNSEITLDMRVFNAGDRLKNWKVKSDLEPDKYPEAKFQLSRIESLREPTAGTFEGIALGIILWRGKSAEIRAKGTAVIDRRTIEAKATFELNVRSLGVEPPKILMFKVEEVVTVEVTLAATALL
jgi:hypothetical protein